MKNQKKKKNLNSFFLLVYRINAHSTYAYMKHCMVGGGGCGDRRKTNDDTLFF